MATRSKAAKTSRAQTRDLIDADSLGEAAPGFLATVAELLRWEAGALWSRSRELSLERGFGMPGRAWESGEIVSLADYSKGLPHPRREAAVGLGLTAALAIPIPVGPPEEVLAVAEFHTASFDEQSAELLALLTGFADQLASFMTRSRERAEAERVRQRGSDRIAQNLQRGATAMLLRLRRPPRSRGAGGDGALAGRGRVGGADRAPAG